MNDDATAAAGPARVLTGLLLALQVLLAAAAPAEVPEPPRLDAKDEAAQLRREVLAADAALFAAFNAGDAAAMAPFFSERLEFFHDTGGLSGYEQSLRQFAQNFARPGLKLRRELLPEGLEVHPLPGIGAMQIGRHRFCSRERQADGHWGEEGCSVYGFSNVWERSPEGRWRLLRVMSYGH